MENILLKDETFFVATKLCLRSHDEILVITETVPNFPLRRDIPGGRVSKSDKDSWLLNTLSREIYEELGINIAFDEMNTTLFYVEKRYERVTFQDDLFPFLFLCYVHDLDDKPEIILSEEHTSYAWIQEEQIDTFSDWRPGFDTIVRKVFQSPPKI